MRFPARGAVNQMMKSVHFLPLVLLTLLLLAPQPAYAGGDIALALRGVAKTVGAAFQVPIGVLSNSTTAFPFGMVIGAIGGTAKAVSGTLSGAWDIARGAGPYAKYMIFL